MTSDAAIASPSHSEEEEDFIRGIYFFSRRWMGGNGQFAVWEMAPFAAVAFTAAVENAASGDNYRIFYSPSQVTALVLPNSRGLVGLEESHDFGLLKFEHTKLRLACLDDAYVFVREILKPDGDWHEVPKDISHLVQAVHRE